MKQRTQVGRWYPKDRRTQVLLWLGYAGASLVGCMVWLIGDGLVALGLLYLGMTVLGGLMAWHAHSRRVEADERGLRVVDDFRSRLVAWEDIDEIRPDASGPWATRLVVVTRDGQVVKLPLEPTMTGPVEFWNELIADERPGCSRES